MATGIHSWSPTAANNGTADTNINWAEGQAPSTVNDSARYMMKVIADWAAATGFGVMTGATVGGTANAITLTSPTGTATTARTAGQLYGFKLGANITSTVTIAVDGLTAGAAQYHGAALISGDGASGDYWVVMDDGTNYQLMTPPRLSGPATDYTTDTSGGDVADLIYFADASQGNASNKVTVQKFYDVSLAALTAKAVPVPADYMLLADSAASNVGKSATLTNIFQAIIGLTAKTTPVVADTILLSDSAASNAAVRTTLTQLFTAVAATQANQETATNVVLPVTPGRQQFHPSAAKCWGVIDVAGTPGAVLASYNVTSVARNGNGDYTVTIGTDFSSANYVVVPGLNATSSKRITYANQAAGTFDVFLWNTSDAKNDSGITSFSFTCFGDQ